jgi:hypothetical protein
LQPGFAPPARPTPVWLDPSCRAPQVKSRAIDRLWFYDRSPVISARQSSAIVEAMMELGFIDSKGNLQYDPRIGALVSAAGRGEDGGGAMR